MPFVESVCCFVKRLEHRVPPGPTISAQGENVNEAVSERDGPGRPHRQDQLPEAKKALQGTLLSIQQPPSILSLKLFLSFKYGF